MARLEYSISPSVANPPDRPQPAFSLVANDVNGVTVVTMKGTDEFAKLDDVVVFRTVKGQSLAALYNLKAVRSGAYPDPEVFANDVVVVGDSKARRIFKDLLAVTPGLLTPLIILLRGNR